MNKYKIEIFKKEEALVLGITLKELEKRKEQSGVIEIDAGPKKKKVVKKKKASVDFELVVKNDEG